MAKQTICNWCGTLMTKLDEASGINLHTVAGYGTKYDGDSVELDLCLRCTDKFIETMNTICTIPVMQPEDEPEVFVKDEKSYYVKKDGE